MAPFSNVWLSLALYLEMAYFQMCGVLRNKVYTLQRESKTVSLTTATHRLDAEQVSKCRPQKREGTTALVKSSFQIVATPTSSSIVPFSQFQQGSQLFKSQRKGLLGIKLP